MAPVDTPASFFLAPLEKCLGEGHSLISWKTAYDAFNDVNLAQNCQNLKSFLSDELSIAQLAREFDPFQPGTPQTKADFEARIANVKVADSGTVNYDIKQIKDDTVWLSQEAKVDEVTALRIVILEWQSRSAARILLGYTKEENISLQRAVRAADLSASAFAPPHAREGKNLADNDFDSDENRHARLLSTFLSEREHILGISFLLSASSLQDPLEPYVRKYATQKKKRTRTIPWLEIAAKKREDARASSKHSPLDPIVQAVQSLEKRIRALEIGSGWSDVGISSQQLEVAFQSSQAVEMIRILEILFVRISLLSRLVPSKSVQVWFEFAQKYSYFQFLQLPYDDEQQSLGRTQALICLISLHVLRLPYALEYIAATPPLNLPEISLLSSPWRERITLTFEEDDQQSSGIAALAKFAWSVILRDADNASRTESASMKTDTLGQGSTSPQSTRTDSSDKKERKETETTAMLMARSAIDQSRMFTVMGQVAQMLPLLFDCPWEWQPQFHARVALLEVLGLSVFYSQYNEDLVQAFLATMQCGTRFTAMHGNNISFPEISAKLVELVNLDEGLSNGFMGQAEYRYPYEMVPYLRICQALIPACYSTTDDSQTNLPLPEITETLTNVLPIGFADFEVSLEQEEMNVIRLTADLPLFVSTQKTYFPVSSRGQKQSLVQADQGCPEMRIPSGTVGRIMGDSKPPLVIWAHRYSTTKYMSLLLSTATPNSHLRAVPGNGLLDMEMQTDNINLLTAICSRNPSHAFRILEEASDDLERNEDIITVVATIFELELSSSAHQRDDGWIDLLSSCLRFFSTIMKYMPNRIWPILARSELLGINGVGSKISAIAASLDATSGRQKFLHECVGLLDTLVTDVLSHAMSRNGQTVSPLNRFGKAPGISTGISAKMMEKIILALTHQAVILLQASNSDFQTLRLETSTKITELLTRIVDCVYGFGMGEKAQDKLTAVLAPTAGFILDEFLASSGNVLTIPLLAVSSHLQPTFGVPIRSALSHGFHSRIHSTLTLLATLLRVSASLDTPSSCLKNQLFDILPFLVRLYACEEAHKNSVLVLISGVVENATAPGGESASILAHIASGTGQNFLNLLQNSNRTLDDANLDNSIWELLAVVMNDKQRSFATWVIMGDTPKNSLKNGRRTSVEEPAKKSLLGIALDELSKPAALTTAKAPSMLKFVNAAQNYWPWVTNSIRKHVSFLTQTTDFLEKLKEHITTAQASQSHLLHVAGLTLNVLTVYLHNMRQLSDTSFVKVLGPKLSYFREYGVQLPSYNFSLHANLKKNFEKKFPGHSLSNFKRILNTSNSNDRSFYDMAFASEVLSFDSAWKHGFAKEFSLANQNLSIVEAQVKLLASWKSLATELSTNLAQEKALGKLMARTALKCMQASSDAKPNEPFFDDLLQSRAELAFALSQRLVSVKFDGSDMRSLISATWNVISIATTDFETGVGGPAVAYYRLLLEILLLALQVHTYPMPTLVSTENTEGTESCNETSVALVEPDDTIRDIFPLLCEIVTEVVGKGFRALATQLHTAPTNVLPSDFALLTSILQTILRVRKVHPIYNNIMLHLCENSVHRYALALFSWANRLLGPDNDPIIGDLSISFIHELSNIPQMAEYLATEGILNQLSTAPLLGYLREKPTGFGPLDQPYRLHAIWCRGILPLTLNILVAVGDSFAAEATAFLNTFPHQLRRITSAFGAKATGTGNITLDDAAEVHTVALLAVALDRYRGSAAAVAMSGGAIPGLEGDWTGLREDLEGWFNGRVGGSGKGRIVPRSEREAGFARAKPEGREAVGEAGSRLEEMVLVELRGAVILLGGNGGVV